MFWPANYSVLYPYPEHWPTGQLLGAAALLLGISALAFARWRQQPYLLVGWLWYLGMLVPVIGLIPLGAQSISNRYTYFPMIGILLLVVWATNDLSKRWPRRNIITAAAVALITGVCLFRTRAELVYWKDGETLWRRAIAVTPNNFMAHYCLATVIWSKNSGEEVVEYQKSVDGFPDYEDAQRELGVAYIRHGSYSNAIGPFKKAIQLNPNDGWAYGDLGMALFEIGRVSESIPYLVQAIEVDPQNANYKYNIGWVLFSAKSNPDWITNVLAIARSDPVGFGKFLHATEFDTNQVSLINNLAWVFTFNADPKLRNGKYAVELAKRACEMSGYRTNVMVGTLAAAYAEDSQFDEAISNAQMAIALTANSGQTNLLNEYEAMLKRFQAHQPFH
jgi:hypothetical protein